VKKESILIEQYINEVIQKRYIINQVEDQLSHINEASHHQDQHIKEVVHLQEAVIHHHQEVQEVEVLLHQEVLVAGAGVEDNNYFFINFNLFDNKLIINSILSSGANK